MNGNCLQTLKENKNRISSILKLSYNLVIILSEDESIKLWDWQQNKLVQNFEN